MNDFARQENICFTHFRIKWEERESTYGLSEWRESVLFKAHVGTY